MISRLMLGAAVLVVPFLGACAHGYVGIGIHDRYYHPPVVVHEDRPVIVHEDRPVVVHEDHPVVVQHDQDYWHADAR